VAASAPEYLSIETIPAEIIEREKEIAMKEVDPKKPQEIIEKIIAGKMQKFYEDNVLLEQRYFKDDTKKIKDLINEAVAAIGEKIEVGRYCRFQLAKQAIYSTL
jgi:elongation factor Ts